MTFGLCSRPSSYRRMKVDMRKSTYATHITMGTDVEHGRSARNGNEVREQAVFRKKPQQAIFYISATERTRDEYY